MATVCDSRTYQMLQGLTVMMQVTDVAFLHELPCITHTAYVCCIQILRETESVGHMAPSSTSAPGPSHKRTEAKLVLQLATWMANTGQGAKSDITGLPQASKLSSCQVLVQLEQPDFHSQLSCTVLSNMGSLSSIHQQSGFSHAR